MAPVRSVNGYVSVNMAQHFTRYLFLCEYFGSMATIIMRATHVLRRDLFSSGASRIYTVMITRAHTFTDAYDSR